MGRLAFQHPLEVLHFAISGVQRKVAVGQPEPCAVIPSLLRSFGFLPELPGKAGCVLQVREPAPGGRVGDLEHQRVRDAEQKEHDEARSGNAVERLRLRPLRRAFASPAQGRRHGDRGGMDGEEVVHEQDERAVQGICPPQGRQDKLGGEPQSGHEEKDPEGQEIEDEKERADSAEEGPVHAGSLPDHRAAGMKRMSIRRRTTPRTTKDAEGKRRARNGSETALATVAANRVARRW